MPLVSSGVENGNLRELAMARMKDFGAECRDVRAREVGVHEIHNKVRPDEVELIRRDYTANGGWETFLAYEDPERDILVGLLRLRKCSDKTFRPELLKDGQTSIVRELHGENWCSSISRWTDSGICPVYGTAVPIDSRDPTKVPSSLSWLARVWANLGQQFQHQGFGTLLMEEAERIARDEHGSVKLAVISG